MVTDARISAHTNPITIFLYCVIVKNMVAGMVYPHSTTATEVRARNLQQLSVASAFTFFSTFVCKTSACSGVSQDSQIRVNLNKDAPTLWCVSGLPNWSKPKHRRVADFLFTYNMLVKKHSDIIAHIILTRANQHIQ